MIWEENEDLLRGKISRRIFEDEYQTRFKGMSAKNVALLLAAAYMDIEKIKAAVVAGASLCVIDS